MADPPDLQNLGVGLDDLVGLVLTAEPDGDELTRLSVAVMVSARLGEIGDHLVGHFVDQARHAGATWTSIGSSMGVTKQAAQKRFVPGAGFGPQGRLFSRFTPRARNAVDTARGEARRLKSDEVRPEHLLLGLMAEKEGLAARALESQGVTAGKLRKKIAATAPAESGDPQVGPRVGNFLADRVMFGSKSKKALKVAVREALRRQHNYIGTEHLLLGVLADDDSTASRLLAELGAARDATTEWVDRTLAEMTAKRKA